MDAFQVDANPLGAVAVGGAAAAVSRLDSGATKEVLQEVDTNAALVEDYFVRPRRYLCDPEGQTMKGWLRAVLLATRYSALMSFLGPLLFLAGFFDAPGHDRHSSMAFNTDGDLRGLFILEQVLYQYGMNLFFFSLTFFPFEFVNAIRTGGPLERLGVGSQRISQADMDLLVRWQKPLVVATIPLVAYGLFALVVLIPEIFIFNPYWVVTGNSIDVELDQNQTEMCGEAEFVHECPIPPPSRRVMMYLYEITTFPLKWIVNPLLCMPSIFGWWYSMKVASALARDTATEVGKEVVWEALEDDERWSSKVAQPTIALAMTTMQELSAGWGRGTGIATLTMWVLSLAQFSKVLVLMVRDEAVEGHVSNAMWLTRLPFLAGTPLGAFLVYMRSLTPTLLAALAPLAIASDVASVSTQCDEHHQAINELRLQWPSTVEQEKVHAKTIPLLFTMERLNQRQGLGCVACIVVVWGRVIDNRTVNIIAASVISFFSTILPLIIGLLPDSSSKGSTVRVHSTLCLIRHATARNIYTATPLRRMRSEQAIGDVCAVDEPLSFTVDLTSPYDAQATVARALSALNISCIGVVNVTIGL